MSRWKAFLLAFVSAALLGLAYPPVGLGFLAWAALVPLLFVVIMALFVCRGPWWMRRGHGHGGQQETSREILDRRFAGGEITTDQYEEMKRVLAG